MSDLRVHKGVERSRPFEIEVDGEKLVASEGESIAAVLLASEQKKHPRGIYCGIGLCHDCLMVINGVPNIRACQTLARPGYKVETQRGLSVREDRA